MAAYYNEHDPGAAAWLSELIRRGLIADGEVDERSIEDVCPDDVRPFRQQHYFAGVGGWALALELAGWDDSRPVWTGSCPCQPFSAAGARAGFADERHLWPAWFWLIAQCRPGLVFGEQVATGASGPWLDLVFADMENIGYACAPVVLPACGVGAPHIRQRVWFVADDASGGQRIDGRRAAGLVGEPTGGRRERQRHQPALGEPVPAGSPTGSRLAHTSSRGRQGRGVPERPGRQEQAVLEQPWLDCDWIPCADGKARPVESGTFPLAHGVPARVGRLRGYGNAITPQAAAAVIRAYMDIRA
jgi:DNA (cytosine-5)-methyltransferase 1